MINTAVTQILYQLSDEVYEREVPSNPILPALCYRPVTDRPNETLDLTGYREARYQISAVATNSTEADALAKQLRNHLKHLAGAFGGVNISLIKEENTTPDFSGDPNVYRSIIDFTFYYGEQP